MYRGILLTISIVVCATAAEVGAPNLFAAARAEPVEFYAQTTQEKIARDPLIAFVAKGPPNSCGRGCDRWIAIEGSFDRGSAERIRPFLEARPTFPIYLHSRGGLIREAIQLGTQLRKLRTKASVARTAVMGCAGHATSPGCRKLVQTTDHHQAQLRHGEGRCASACVYAFLGASTRTIKSGAQIGIHDASFNHATKQNPSRSAVEDHRRLFLEDLRKHVAEMGGDSALVDLARKVGPTATRTLSRTELAHYGVVTAGPFQSPWLINERAAPLKIVAFKTLTRPSPLNGDEHRTITISVQCINGSGVSLLIKRELATAERGHEPTIRVAADDNVVWASDNKSNENSIYDFRTLRVPPETARKFAPKQNLRYTETYDSGDWTGKSFDLDISLTGLEAGLSKIFRYCPPDS